MPIDLNDTKNLLTTYSLPSRLCYGFDYVGCLTVGDALQLTPDRLQRLPRSGVATLQKWLDVLDIGLTVADLKQTKKMHLTFGEILGIATDNAALTDLATLRLRRMSDEEIEREASKFTWTYRSASTYESFCTGARLARQWQSRLLAVTKKITPVVVRAACGHEYKTGILHTDDDDLREQRAVLALLSCLACVEETQEPHGQVVPFAREIGANSMSDAESDDSAASEMPLKIISGGQTGADRAALDWAIRNNVPHGGYCPKGRRAEDGPIAERYQLQELHVVNYQTRTRRNVEESDGTVVFTIKATRTGGTKLTAQHAQKIGKPLLHLCQHFDTDAAAQLREFIVDHHIRVLNVAGPRASNEPEVGAFVAQTLDMWLALG